MKIFINIPKVLSLRLLEESVSSAFSVERPRIWAEPKATSGTVVLPQPQTVLTSVVPENIKDHASARGLGPCWCPRAMVPWGPCKSGWLAPPPGTMVTPEPGLLSRTMSGSVVLPESGSVLISTVHVVAWMPSIWAATFGSVDV